MRIHPIISRGSGLKRANYLIGVGVTWDITTPLRVHQQVAAQNFTTEGLREEYGLISQELQAQVILSDTKIRNALDNYHEAPIQVKAASDAYIQKETLYKNGLATIVDVTTAAGDPEPGRDGAGCDLHECLAGAACIRRRARGILRYFLMNSELFESWD